MSCEEGSSPQRVSIASLIEPVPYLDRLCTAVAILGRDGVCRQFNMALVSLLGYTVAELTAAPFHDLVHTHDPVCPQCGIEHCPLRTVLEDRTCGTWIFDLTCCRRSGAPIVARCHASTTETGGVYETVLELQDVTEIRSLEQATHAEEITYRSAAAAAVIGTWSRDLRANTVVVCRVMAGLLGLPPRQTVMSATQWQDMIDPDDLSHIEAQVAAQCDSKQPIALEFRVRLPDGRVAWLASRGTIVRDNRDVPISITGMSIDITERKLNEIALQESELRFRLLAEMSPAAILVMCDGKYVYANEEGARMLGARRPDDLLGRSPFDFLNERHRNRFMQRSAQVATQGRSPYEEYELHRADGSTIWVQSTAGKVTWRDRPAIQIVARDVTEERRTQERLRLLSERFSLALASVDQAVWDWDIVQNAYTMSGGLRDLFSWAEPLSGSASEDWRVVTHPEDHERVVRAIDDCLTGREPLYQAEFRVRTSDGSWRWILSRGVVVVRDEAGRPTIMTGTMTDITVHKHSEELAWRHANLDALTGLPNRRLFRERLDQEIAKSARSHRPLALLFIDLDRFKQVNDSLGHAAGDDLLLQAAHRICHCVRRTDTVARLGGDEFTVLLTELDTTAHVDAVSGKILDALNEPFQLGREIAYISGSIGVALYPQDASAADELVRKADQAMYAAKDAGKQQVKFFRKSMDELARRRHQITQELRHAIASSQLSVYYQPVVRLCDHQVVKAEALLRWQHPDLGNIEPSVFIPVAEEAGLIGPIGNWVLEQVAWHAQHWARTCVHAPQITVNQSPLQFAMADPKYDGVRRLIESGVAGRQIAIEITEGTLLDTSPQVRERLLFYRDAGVQVAIDDFGTGYSSLAYLQRFDIDYLKIDQSFVRDITTNPANRTIAETIIVMAHKLGLEVIAEGIESEAQMHCLLEAGCDYGQGFWFSRPLPVADFERTLVAARLQ